MLPTPFLDKSNSTETREIPSPVTAEAIESRRGAAESGDSEARYVLAAMLWAGVDGKPDRDAAREWCRKAAEQGHAAAQYTMGSIASGGWQYPMNRQEAEEWLSKSADQGFSYAVNGLGVLYDNLGGKDNLLKAEEWYLKAADMGNDRAQCNFCSLYSKGVDGKPDSAKAADAYRGFSAPDAPRQGHQQIAPSRIRLFPQRQGEIMKLICMILVAAFLAAASPAVAADVYSALNQCLDKTKKMSERQGISPREDCYEKAVTALESEAKKALAEAKKICSKKMDADSCREGLDKFMSETEVSEDLTQGMIYSLRGNHPYIEQGATYETKIARAQSQIDILRHLIRRSKAVGW